MKIITNELERIADVPLLYLNPYLSNGESMAQVYVALLHLNPTGSHKVLSYQSMVEAEERNGLNPDTIFVDYTTGNAGIAGAFVCAQKGYAFSVFMPENMSYEKIQMLRCLGADIHLTPKEKFILGAKQEAVEYSKTINRILLDQSSNPNNAKGYEIVGEKLIKTLGKIDVFVCGSGTYGTITGISRKLKPTGTEIICIEAEYAPHIFAKRKGVDVTFQPHNLIGFGAELLASNAHPELYDHVEIINEETAVKTMKAMHKKGFLIGKTSGANIYWAIKIAQELGPGKIVATNTFDGFERLITENIYK
ncbi:hypothetical protein COV12_02925 [Candidatus Woesearchaeota archaeon CG10_big_fil_rev_8_21_14_0_10_32_24]|nr:MAG: hypothetical protein COV12_02925 [Candidatus Woesearchaeota archaeon CG10_big_fil_rev_8_21_14_0_10_32_24]